MNSGSRLPLLILATAVIAVVALVLLRDDRSPAPGVAAPRVDDAAGADDAGPEDIEPARVAVPLFRPSAATIMRPVRTVPDPSVTVAPDGVVD